MNTGLDENEENVVEDTKENSEALINNNNAIKKEDSLAKSILDIIIYVAVMMVIVLFIVTFVVQKVQVSGSSMNDTLCDGEQLILEKVSYRFGHPQRFDVVVFRPFETGKKLYYIKRVIGLPGEKIQIINGDIYINDEILEENYGKEKMLDPGIASEPVKLGEDEYFLLGDNRNHSKDSRVDDVGIVNRNQISGRALVRIWPLNKMGFLRHQ